MTRKLLSAIALVTALVWAAGPPAAPAASSPECSVTDLRTKLAYFELQSAVDAAAPGDTLRVAGTCRGDSTLDFDLTLAGRPGATLDGANSASMPGSVITVGGRADVTIRKVTITGGYASEELHEFAGGVYVVGSTLTLMNATITGNVAAAPLLDAPGAYGGGGIYNSEGSVTLLHSRVTSNQAPGFGGGIYNAGGLSLSRSRVSGNAATYSNRGMLEVTRGGGIYDAPGSQASVSESTVSGNRAGAGVNCDYGGGIANDEATLTLTHTKVDENNAAGFCGGGGVMNTGSLTLESSSLARNTAAGGVGGGIYTAKRSGNGESTTLLGSSLVARNSARAGGGIAGEAGLLTLSGSSSVTGNEASERGGGILLDEELGARLAFSEWSGRVSGNRPDNIETY
jgi:hypothetical protein